VISILEDSPRVLTRFCARRISTSSSDPDSNAAAHANAAWALALDLRPGRTVVAAAAGLVGQLVKAEALLRTLSGLMLALPVEQPQ
jgi:hypothetical protein